MKNLLHDRVWLKETLLRLLVVTVASLIIAVNLKSFVQAGDLFPGGFTGLTRMIQRCALQFWNVTLPFGPINLLFNAVPAVISYKLIGKRFTIYSCLAIVLISVFTDLIPTLPVTEDMLLVCVFGGIASGFGAGLYLMVRVTGGGTDFIAIALAERRNVDAWNYILVGNVIMLAVAGVLFGWERALYSIIYQYVTTQVVRMMDPESKRVTLFIVTGRESAGGVCAQIQETNHSATLIEGVGLYNGAPCVMIYSVVDGKQIRRLIHNVRQTDPQAFVNALKTDKLKGKFYRPPRD